MACERVSSFCLQSSPVGRLNSCWTADNLLTIARVLGDIYYLPPMGCVSSKQKAIFVDQSGQEIAVPRRPTWQERNPGRKIRSQGQKSKGPPSPVVHEPAPWVKGHALLKEKDGELVIVEEQLPQ